MRSANDMRDIVFEDNIRTIEDLKEVLARVVERVNTENSKRDVSVSLLKLNQIKESANQLIKTLEIANNESSRLFFDLSFYPEQAKKLEFENQVMTSANLEALYREIVNVSKDYLSSELKEELSEDIDIAQERKVSYGDDHQVPKSTIKYADKVSKQVIAAAMVSVERKEILQLKLKMQSLQEDYVVIQQQVAKMGDHLQNSSGKLPKSMPALVRFFAAKWASRPDYQVTLDALQSSLQRKALLQAKLEQLNDLSRSLTSNHEISSLIIGLKGGAYVASFTGERVKIAKTILKNYKAIFGSINRKNADNIAKLNRQLVKEMANEDNKIVELDAVLVKIRRQTAANNNMQDKSARLEIRDSTANLIQLKLVEKKEQQIKRNDTKNSCALLAGRFLSFFTRCSGSSGKTLLNQQAGISFVHKK